MSFHSVEDSGLDFHNFSVSEAWESGGTCAPRGLAWGAKELVERAFALCLIVFLAPLLILISLLIVLETRGPAIFVQPRFGRNEEPFGVFKFRTMRAERCDLSGASQTADDDPRVTRIGYLLRRTSIDEVPQLFNVLLGHMAIIGPRAHPCGMCVETVECVDVLPAYHSRHVVKPGITGWAQVNGSRGAVKTAAMLSNRVNLDLFYINNWSLWLDLKIIFRTITVVVGGKLAT